MTDYLVSSRNGFVEMTMPQHSVAASAPRRSQTLPAAEIAALVQNLKNADEDKVLYHISSVRDSCGADSILGDIQGMEKVMGRPSWRERPSIDPSFLMDAIKWGPSNNRLSVIGPSPRDYSSTVSSPSNCRSRIISFDDSLVLSPKISMDGMPCPSVAIDQIKTRYTAVLERYRDESQAIPQEEWTSIMIKNIPCRYVQDEILDEIKSAGYVLDFLYLPPARRTAGNLGYCFVNFVTPAQARDFFEAFQGHHFALQPKSKKRANVLWANLQGFQKNCEFYQNAKVMKSKFQPFVDRAAHVQYAYERKCAE